MGIWQALADGGQASGYVRIPYYTTGWINTADWTNQHLGTTAGADVTHNLNTPLSRLFIKLLINATATEIGAVEILPNMVSPAIAGAAVYGCTIYGVSNNAFTIQTGVDGICIPHTDGTSVIIDTENWNYNVYVYGWPTNI